MNEMNDLEKFRCHLSQHMQNEMNDLEKFRCHLSQHMQAAMTIPAGMLDPEPKPWTAIFVDIGGREGRPRHEVPEPHPEIMFAKYRNPARGLNGDPFTIGYHVEHWVLSATDDVERVLVYRPAGTARLEAEAAAVPFDLEEDD